MTTPNDETTTTNDDQAAALIAALVPKISEALLPTLTESVEKQIQGVVSKNTELLGKLAASNTQKSSIEEQLAALTKQVGDGQQKPTEIVLSKADARNPAKYKAAKAQAVEAGIPLTIDRDA